MSDITDEQLLKFEGFPKIARLSRDIVVTEKIDGTNAQIAVVQLVTITREADAQLLWKNDALGLGILAGSRNRWLGLGKQDNHAFAFWVKENAHELVKLGPGRHFGEWWGKGIGRNYGLQEKRFSLFNTGRWADRHMGELTYIGDGEVGSLPGEGLFAPECCRVVPVLYQGPFHTEAVEDCIEELGREGSKAARGFMKPEGVVVFHRASGTLFKKTLEKDEAPKSSMLQSLPERPEDREYETVYTVPPFES